MTAITKRLIYEGLIKMRGDVAQLNERLADHSRQFIRIRADINARRTDMKCLRGGYLRHEKVQAQMANRLERIETRLGLSDA